VPRRRAVLSRFIAWEGSERPPIGRRREKETADLRMWRRWGVEKKKEEVFASSAPKRKGLAIDPLRGERKGKKKGPKKERSCALRAMPAS